MHLLSIEIRGDSPNFNQWVVIGLGAVTLLYVVFVRPAGRKRKPADPLARTPSQANLAQQRALERDMSNLLVEYEEMIRRMTAQVDTRAAKLQTLIDDADQRIAALTAAQHARAAAPRWAPDQTPPAGNGERAPALPEAAAGPPPDTIDARYTEIYDLSDRGLTAQEIAHELSRPCGEVELILALRAPRT